MHGLTGGREDGGVNGRDRDGEGRARSARPRDGLGRPLPYGAQGVERQPEGVPRSPGESVAEAQRLLDAGMPFHAHEVFEDAWKSGPGSEAALWRGLAQLAVGLTHAARGNAVGGARLLRRGADVLAGRAGEREREGEGDEGGAASGTGSAYGMDLPGLVRWARELAERVEGGAAVDAAAEAPHLAAGPGPA
ncbi:DUF309 domain-containing protein [Streptomyces sp. NPDC006544]|uniref:DUF309 domain-containing protein n=1 Tax=Streptomyces sp. NPDC006544 TaxID=3154583 RepID=UPI0033B8C69F